jgi:flagellar biosynthetic protein FliS
MATAAPQRLTGEIPEAGSRRGRLALYAETVSALNDAIDAIVADDIEARCTAVQAATEAVTTLYLSLDVKRSGEHVDDLADLYGYILGRLLRINLYNDARIAEQVIGLIDPLRDSADGLGTMAEMPPMPAIVRRRADRPRRAE